MNDIAAQIRHFVRHRRNASILIGAGLLALVALAIFIASGRYPVMVVNGTFITAARFEKNYASATILHNNQLKINAESPEALEVLKRVTPAELGAGVLDTLVVAALVERAASREAGRDLRALVEAKVGEFTNDPQVRSGVQTLYGMGYADFENEVLVPAAERDILEGRLYLRGQNYDDWLANERKNASVYVFSSRFRWGGERIVPQ